MIERELDKYIDNHYNTNDSVHKNDFASLKLK